MDNESIIHVSASFGLERIRSVLFSTVAIVYYYYIVYVVLKLIMLHRNSDRRVVLKPWQESLNEAWKNGVAPSPPPPHSPGALVSHTAHCLICHIKGY